VVQVMMIKTDASETVVEKRRLCFALKGGAQGVDRDGRKHFGLSPARLSNTKPTKRSTEIQAFTN